MDDTVDLQNEYSSTNNLLPGNLINNNNSTNLSRSSSFNNITIKTNLSAIEATNRALEKSVVSPGEYPSFPSPQPKGSKGSLNRLAKSYSSNMINSINNNQNVQQRNGSQLKYDIEINDNNESGGMYNKNNINYEPALQVNSNQYCKFKKKKKINKKKKKKKINKKIKYIYYEFKKCLNYLYIY